MDEARLAGLQLKEKSSEPGWTFDVRPNQLVRTGVPADIVLETADDVTANLVVLGAHRRRSLRQTFKGSVAERIAESRRYPILIVRRKPRATYRNVVLALDLSESSGGAVRYAESVGIFADAARCTILHAYEPRYHDAFRYVHGDVPSIDIHIASWRRDYRNAVTDMLTTASARPSRYDVVLDEGRATPVILNHLRRHNPDLLIMGTRGGGKLHRAFLGSIAHEVTRQARCDVMLVPQGVKAIQPSVTVAISARWEAPLTTSRGA
jgi:nucleotide-binding universal stress UspA family protein